MNSQHFVSVIVPCRNEAQFIRTCLDSIIADDYPRDRLEVLLVDGMSDDATRAILAEYASRCSFMRVVQNPQRVTPNAFNIGISQARGDLIMLMSAHAAFGQNVISQCVKFSEEYNADNVGGVWKMHPRDQTLTGRAITCALSHQFGVGRSFYRTIGEDRTEPLWADTAAYGCYRKEVFEKIGTFNERLTHSQDMEFNLRLKKAGGRTLLVPSIVINYYARSDFWSFCQHNFRNGLWVLLPFAYSEVMPVSGRHLVPLTFVTTLLGSTVLGFLAGSLSWLPITIACSYVLANLSASVQVARRERDIRLFFVMPIVFLTLHIGYGLGSLWGAVRLVCLPQFWTRLFSAARHPRVKLLKPGPDSKDVFL